jgi:hypothetical protein
LDEKGEKIEEDEGIEEGEGTKKGRRRGGGNIIMANDGLHFWTCKMPKLLGLSGNEVEERCNKSLQRTRRKE